jgi:hypothetical protein
MLAGVVSVALVAVAIFEARTSRIQAWYFTRAAADLEYAVGEGPSPVTVTPPAGPYDIRLGYTRIPGLAARLDSLGFELIAQARPGAGLLSTLQMGAYPIYDAKMAAGLTVLDRRGAPLVEERYPAAAFATFDSIPELLWRSLLFIESRRFLDERHPQRNPAVEWVRLVRSVAELGLRTMGMERSVPGASTLATQLEKFRHSPQGLTLSPQDKLRQMLTASLRAYRQGPNTLEVRRRTVTEYLNSVPLAAQVGHGEVIGTADGLWAWYGAELHEVNRLLRTEPTDAEGRVVLADVLDVVRGLAPKRMIDLATLTGACMVALGHDVAGLFTNDQACCDALAAAARSVGEPVWQLPMDADYGEQIKSDVADIKNVGDGRWGGAITAAKFLERFVGDTPWTHVDIAGPAFAEKPRPWTDGGGTGVMVRPLVELARTTA